MENIQDTSTRRADRFEKRHERHRNTIGYATLISALPLKTHTEKKNLWVMYLLTKISHDTKASVIQILTTINILRIWNHMPIVPRNDYITNTTTNHKYFCMAFKFVYCLKFLLVRSPRTSTKRPTSRIVHTTELLIRIKDAVMTAVCEVQ